ncbi:hypothetical protein IJJ97_06725, partial [bacterium]|nr:hypothetical protein [bacterium]
KNLETKSGYGIFYANFFRSNDGNHKLFIDSIHVKLYSQTTIKKLIEETVNSKNKLQPKYVLVKEQNMTIDGKNATSALFIGVNISKLTIKTEKIFIQNGDNIYVFELQTREDRFKRGKKDFDKIIQSVKFT